MPRKSDRSTAAYIGPNGRLSIGRTIGPGFHHVERDSTTDCPPHAVKRQRLAPAELHKRAYTTNHQFCGRRPLPQLSYSRRGPCTPSSPRGGGTKAPRRFVVDGLG